MDIVREITDFFARLFRQQVNSVQAKANAKVRSAEVKARSKTAAAVNNKIKQGTQAAVGKAKGVAGKGPADKNAEK